MSRVRDVISQLRSTIRNATPDVRFTNQFLHNTIIDAAKLIIKREVESRKIYRSVEEFKSIDCFHLEPFDATACANIFVPVCNNIMRSVEKIPKAYQSSLGYILMVFSVGRLTKFDQTTPAIYESLKKREFKAPNKYFWIIDDYLYIPDSNISVVTILGLFINNAEVDALNGVDSCRFMDSETGFPQWLEKDILDTAATVLGNITLRVPEDVNPNLNSAQ